MDGGRKSRDPYKLPEDRRERKSGSGMSGDPKKGGRGGKFTWEGADGYTDEDLHLIGNKGTGSAASAAANRKKAQNNDGGDTSDE